MFKKTKKLDGIIHAAGIINDAFFIQKDINAFLKVAEPKILGAQNLNLVFSPLKLDFVVYFSSIASVMGNVGQTDYAFANAYLDYFAIQQNEQSSGTKYISIHWPLWENGGMQINESILKRQQSVTGIDLLQNNSGLIAFEKILNNSQTGVSVLTGNKQSINQFILKSFSRDVQNDNERAVSKKDDNSLIQLEKDIMDLVARILAIDVKAIDTITDINEYGIDSITLFEIMSKLESQYQIQLSVGELINYPTIKSLAEFLMSRGINNQTISNPKLNPHVSWISEERKRNPKLGLKSEAHPVGQIRTEKLSDLEKVLRVEPPELEPFDTIQVITDKRHLQPIFRTPTA